MEISKTLKFKDFAIWCIIRWMLKFCDNLAFTKLYIDYNVARELFQLHLFFVKLDDKAIILVTALVSELWSDLVDKREYTPDVGGTTELVIPLRACDAIADIGLM